MNTENMTLTAVNAIRARQNQNAYGVSHEKDLRTKKPYTPQFSTGATIAIRRLAWAKDENMIKTIERLIKLLPAIFDSGEVCHCCKDRSKCVQCVFNHILTATEIQKLTAK
jgi:hypothetical protein